LRLDGTRGWRGSHRLKRVLIHRADGGLVRLLHSTIRAFFHNSCQGFGAWSSIAIRSGVKSSPGAWHNYNSGSLKWAPVVRQRNVIFKSENGGSALIGFGICWWWSKRFRWARLTASLPQTGSAAAPQPCVVEPRATVRRLGRRTPAKLWINRIMRTNCVTPMRSTQLPIDTLASIEFSASAPPIPAIPPEPPSPHVKSLSSGSPLWLGENKQPALFKALVRARLNFQLPAGVRQMI
jgi:hypothetical protein